MKPFRGKPEKPERSNGEIQRVSSAPERWTLETVTDLAVRRSLRPRSLCRGDERVHFSPSRTSRPVGCRPKDRGGDRVAPSGCFRSDPRLPACSPDGTAVARGRESKFASGPSQVLADIWWASGDLCLDSTGPVRLLATVSSDRLRYTPVGDALALGTFRTRLETRTKESSMFASHWDLAKPKGVMKVKAVPSACPGRMRRTT